MTETLPACSAVIRFLSSVNPLVWFQMSWMTESLVTVWTLVRFLSSVDPLVWFQISWIIESLVAVWTLVRFLSSVNPLVLFQFCSCNKKSSHTQSTYILSHQCVSSDVVLNSAAVKNSFHIKNMNVVSPSNELSGDSSGLKPTKMFFHIDHIHALSLQCGWSCGS